MVKISAKKCLSEILQILLFERRDFATEKTREKVFAVEQSLLCGEVQDTSDVELDDSIKVCGDCALNAPHSKQDTGLVADSGLF